MMNQKNKLNIVDWIALTIVGLFVALLIVIANQPERDLGDPAHLTIRVSNVDISVCAEANKKGTVYLNGVDYPAEISSVSCDGGEMTITLEASGTKDGERLTFNGQRMLVGQKAEIHGSFWAQGIIIGFEIE